MQLRAYQQQAIDDLRAAMQRGARSPLLCLPTGGGKTIIFSAIASSAAARGRQVLILVHRRELIHQASAKLHQAGVEHGIIAAGFNPSSNLVQVASIQTLVRRLDRIDWSPSLIILDEAHHACAGQWERILSHWPTAYRLGVTATPCRLDGRGLSIAFDALVLGPSVADLTTWGFLSPARIYAPPVVADLSAVRTRAGDYANDQAAAAMDRPTVTGDAISHYQRFAAGQQAIAFCCNIAHATSVCDAFKTAGIRAALLLGSTTDRDAVVAAFGDGSLQVLVTVDVVSEGFDIPAASCAILLRPTKSLGLYLQQVGRVLRPAPGKQHAIILDHVGNVPRHGFPDDHCEWSLAEGARRSNGQAAPSVRTCPVCFAAFKAAPICPCCGHEQPAAKVRPLRQVAGELQELRRYKIATVTDRVTSAINAGCQTVDEVLAWALAHECQLTRQEVERTVKRIDETWYRRELRNRRSGQGQARTLPELMALAKQRGYSPAWAWKVHHARSRSA